MLASEHGVSRVNYICCVFNESYINNFMYDHSKDESQQLESFSGILLVWAGINVNADIAHSPQYERREKKINKKKNTNMTLVN